MFRIEDSYNQDETTNCLYLTRSQAIGLWNSLALILEDNALKSVDAGLGISIKWEEHLSAS